MEKSYWEDIAPNYEDEIFDVLKNDTSKSIVNAILEISNKKHSIIDIGCAVGKWIPVLTPIFGSVHAIDISLKNLKIAKKHYKQLKNVTYERVDMSGSKLPSKKYDAAICINAILTANLKKRNVFFNHLASLLKKGGDLVLVVPSLESKLFSHIIANKYNLDNAKNDKAPTGKKAIEQIKYIKDGVTEIDKVPTKHFLKEELELLLSLEGFKVLEIVKIKYNWNTEFLQPPKWLKDPKPWDWLVVAKKQ